MQENPSAQQPELEETPVTEVSPEAASAEAAESAQVDTLPSLEEQLRQTELKLAEHHDAWLRAKAETENVRRRAAEDIQKASKFAIEKFATELLPVKDSLEQTLAVANPTLETIREGVELTLRNLARAFERGNLTELDPVGAKFDPHQHQAMSMVESDQPANTVVQVFQKGYLIEGRVVRPAMVAVSKGQG
ncbi:nucleotide exchange factor GrpE [Niveibacterium umoris]|uniref:Protein GrpE n=1 Tax=Niveibacterium umoris TaxID=1193620 RepID=A0A840BKL6_9RHOO|nr:nucleotide exchange factor GrpE [Niveibacterium umoris]MBB4012089.1 molecular chaperone GrpE [Niveibacterium umoris]